VRNDHYRNILSRRLSIDFTWSSTETAPTKFEGVTVCGK
jgi:hypothetical protein